MKIETRLTIYSSFKCLSAPDVSNHLGYHYFVHDSPEGLVGCTGKPDSKILQSGHPSPTYSSPSHDFSLENNLQKLISLGVSHYVAEILKFVGLDRMDYFFFFIHPLQDFDVRYFIRPFHFQYSSIEPHFNNLQVLYRCLC